VNLDYVLKELEEYKQYEDKDLEVADNLSNKSDVKAS